MRRSYKFKAKPRGKHDEREEREKRLAFTLTVIGTFIMYYVIGAGHGLVLTMAVIYIGSRVILTRRRRT